MGLSDEALWEAVSENDVSLDGVFVYAVVTTGIYCRPSCYARLPKRENIRFFPTSSAAEAAGFRPCQRCQPDQAVNPKTTLVHAICQRIEASSADGGVSLPELAREFNLSQSYLQRTFKAVMGVTPRQYAEALRVAALKGSLREKQDVLDAADAAGFTSSGHLYARIDDLLAMTPSQYRSGGPGMIRCALAESPLGLILAAATDRGICAVRLGDDAGTLLADLRREYPAAQHIDHDPFLREALETILGHLEGHLPRIDLPLDIRATAFQKRVWDELRRIPPGETRSYSRIADDIGEPKASRAVGSACAANPVALIIPCHRARRQDGSTGQYRWGAERKKRLLALEDAATR